MSKKLVLVFMFVFLEFVSPGWANAQTATTSGTATSSDTSTGSATTTSTASASTSTLPATGAHDVLIIFTAGLIFLSAGTSAFSGTKQIFNELDE